MSNLGNKEVMGKNLSYYLKASGKTQREVAEVVGVAPSTFNDWLKAKKYPRIDKIEILAEYFGILKSDLIEDKGESHKTMQRHNNAIADIVVRMRTDEEFFYLVEAISKLDASKVSNLATFFK